VQKTGTTKPRSKGITKESNLGQSGQEQKDGTSNPMSKSGSQNAESSKAIEESEANMDNSEQLKPPPNGKGTEEQGQKGRNPGSSPLSLIRRHSQKEST
jgi:hypothetical protein